jgi:hypothetical protein
MGILRLLGGLLGIAGLLALLVATMVGTAWLVLITVRYVPMIGQRHRHPAWDRDQREITPLRSRGRERPPLR